MSDADARLPGLPLTDRLLPDPPRQSFEAYLAAGGGRALETALSLGPIEVIDEVDDAGLRGRGGAGFPTGAKWRSVRAAAAETETLPQLVVNGAEGEPGTYKDRCLLADNPYQVIEGALIAQHAIGSERVHLGVKAGTEAVAQLEVAIADVVAAGWTEPGALTLTEGPDAYLFGEETGLLEVVEGKLPLPRWLPPFQQGLHATTERVNPTVVNNVETLANVPVILTGGAGAFREAGTARSPGTMLFTVAGDVTTPGVHELPLGTTLRTLLVDIAGAEDIQAVFSGVSSPVIGPDRLDTPLTYEDMRTAGTGLGSGGFIVYDHTHCIVRVAVQLSHFLAIESCGQCTACKLGCAALTGLLRKIEEGRGGVTDLEAIANRTPQITDQTRCALPNGEQLLVGSLLDTFPDRFVDHLGRRCDATPTEQVPKIVALDPATGRFSYDPDYHRKRPDWSYAPVVAS